MPDLETMSSRTRNLLKRTLLLQVARGGNPLRLECLQVLQRLISTWDERYDFMIDFLRAFIDASARNFGGADSPEIDRRVMFRSRGSLTVFSLGVCLLLQACQDISLME